jgi:hypothetical protein
MDVKSFRRKVPPGRRGSKLAPYLKQMRALRSDGYTLGQVCEFLAANRVLVTAAGVSVFLKRQERKVPSGGTRTSRRRE